MQYELQVFQNADFKELRTIEIDGAPWFVLGDVCRAVDLQKKKGSYWHHTERLDPDETRRVPRGLVPRATSPLRGGVGTAGGNLIVVSESGLYALILTSKKPEAKRFRKWITAEVLPSIRRTGGYGRSNAPAFIQRFTANWDRVAPGHFSIINELAVRLYGRLEMVGHIMADRAPDGRELRPDNSVGRLFADFLREDHPDVSGEFTYYDHVTEEWSGPARQYPIKLLPLYIEFVDMIWIPQHSQRYFKTRDPEALPHLPKLLTAPRQDSVGLRP